MPTLRDRVNSLVPAPLTSGVKGALVRYGKLTAQRRPLPDFLIIGTKRGGTTSLWNYLLQHPLVPRLFPAWNTKTSHYFEENWAHGPAWYRSHFPTAHQRAAIETREGGRTRVGEAAPLYMFHPLAAGRVHDLIPTVRLIVLLRDPVERAYSHWKERRTEGTEPLDFREALAAEAERTAGERERLIAEPNYHSEAYDRYTYRARGRYLDHLEPWLDRFERRQILFLPSESFYADPSDAYRQVLDFLELPAHELADYRVYNDRRSSPMDADLRAELIDYYRPHNVSLADRLDMRFAWAGLD